MKIEIANREDAQMDLEQIQQDIEAEGFDITCGVNRQGNIVLTGSKDQIAQLTCTPEFREAFFAGASVKTVKAQITE